MFKKIMLRGWAGFILGVFIITFISLLTSTFYGNGNYIPVSKLFIKECGSEILATWIVFILAGILGFCYGAGSLIFENDKLNIVVQTVLHCAISAPVQFLVGWVCYWMPHNFLGITIWIIESLIIYVIVWLCFYFNYKNEVKKVNEALKNNE